MAAAVTEVDTSIRYMLISVPRLPLLLRHNSSQPVLQAALWQAPLERMPIGNTLMCVAVLLEWTTLEVCSYIVSIANNGYSDFKALQNVSRKFEYAYWALKLYIARP